MNIVDYIMIAFLLLFALKGFRRGLLPSIVNLASSLLVFVIAFYLKTPISTFLYENLPFLKFGGIFKGVVAINILFYEGIAYAIAISILFIVFAILKKISKIMEKILNLTIFLSLPAKIVGAIVGIAEGLLYAFVLLYIASVVNTTSTYVNNSKYASKILTDIPVVKDVTSDLTLSTKEVYNTILNNANDTNRANLDSINILMKYDILSYDSAKKLYDDGKLNILGVETVIEEYKEN